ncbi:MAG: hypothetical protein Q4E54_08230 [Lachnospiraceae bacterium]|nr:hypothetical protein [Lachnospiraceae bacterium]
MSKTKEELNELKQQYEELQEKCRELTMEELEQVTGGIDPKDRDIAMVFQNYALYPHMTVYDN